MSDGWDDNNNDGNQNQNQGSGLRAQLEKALAEKKAAEELNARLTETVRSNTIKDLITAKGFDPRAAKFVPREVELTEEKIGAWLDENAELLPKAAPVTPQTPAPQDATAGNETDQNDRMGTAAALGLPPEKARDLENRIQDAKSAEELDKIMASAKGIRFN